MKRTRQLRPPRVVDCHAHIFPYLGGPSGFSSAEEHLFVIQRGMATHGAQPVRRARDQAIVTEATLWDPNDPSPEGCYPVDFKVGSNNGRFEWRKDGEGYYIQFMPPTLQTMAAPAEFMINQMDYAGIDVAVLHNERMYGKLNSYFSEALKRYPDRFIALAQVDEARAYEDSEIERLRHAVEDQGMKGLYYTVATFFSVGYRFYYSDSRFTAFWNEVERLQLPVFWVFPTSSPIGDFREEMRHFRSWLERYPRVHSVLVHGLPEQLFSDDDGKLHLPDYLTDIMDLFPVYSELLFPLRRGGLWDYPYPQAHAVIEQLYQRFGPTRLLWGSDMPNVERYCTYRQTLSYFTDHCSYIADDDIDKILAGNTLELFGT